MDLEELNKSQIVLLTMLVSFVTSIATGIVTVSLVEEAPSDVTRVVQRVVERTVEQVSPETQQATVITKEKTIIIKEADQIAAAIAATKGKIVSVVREEDASFVSLGVFIDEDGTLATDASAIDAHDAYAIVYGEETLPLSVVYEGGARGIALLRLPQEVQVPVELVDEPHTTLQLGQTLVAFVGGGAITQGIVAELGESGFIGTTIASPKVAPGAILLTVDGDVVGMSTGISREMGGGVFAPLRAAFAQVANVQAQETTATTTTQVTE